MNRFFNVCSKIQMYLIRNEFETIRKIELWSLENEISKIRN